MSNITIKLVTSLVLLSAGLGGASFADSSKRSTGLGNALDNTVNTPAHGVVSTVGSNNPGPGFGASVSGSANQQGVSSSSQGFAASGGVGGAGGSHRR